MERYYSLNSYLKNQYGEKMYKLSLNGGMTCPNRDGKLGTRGCIFCSAGGSGDFAADHSLSVSSQILQAKDLIKEKYHGNSYIAYFQAYTNTYAPVDYLRTLFLETIAFPEIKILSIATRPDCLDDEIIDLLRELNLIKPVWIELGLQTICPTTAEFIRRGYDLPIFESAVQRLRAAGITVIVHVILGLPGETKDQMLETIDYLNQTDIQGIKLQLLHVLKGTVLADYYAATPFHIFEMEEYFTFLGDCINHLRPDIVIHRLTGDGPKDLLIAPLWTGRKRYVLNQMHASFKQHNIQQGKELLNGTTI